MSSIEVNQTLSSPRRLTLRERLEMPAFTKELRTRMRGMRTPFLLFTSSAMAILVAMVIFSWLVDPEDEAVAGKTIFIWLALLQGVFITLISPAQTAGAITSEREQGTLEALLLTPLSSRGILLGKLCSALSLIIIILLSVVPVMAVAFLLGGVSPVQVAWVVALVLGTATLFGAVGLYLSTRFRHTVTAMCVSYVSCLGWLIAVPILVYFQQYRPNAHIDALSTILFAILLPLLCAQVAAVLIHRWTHRKVSWTFRIIMYTLSVFTGFAFLTITNMVTEAMFALGTMLLLVILSVPCLVLTSFIYGHFSGKPIRTGMLLLLAVSLAVAGSYLMYIFDTNMHLDADIFHFGNPAIALWRMLYPDSGQSPWSASWLPPVTVALLLLGAWLILALAERHLARERDCMAMERERRERA